MNNIRKFATEADYSAATINTPSVSWVVETDTVHYDPYVPPVSSYKIKLTCSDGITRYLQCDGDPVLTYYIDEVTGIGHPEWSDFNDYDPTWEQTGEYPTISLFEIGDCITEIAEVFDGGILNTAQAVKIPDSVTTIGEYSFTHKEELQTVEIGSGITFIGWGCFDYLNSLTTLIIKATTPPTVEDFEFAVQVSSHGGTIYVPAESVNAYKAAWNEEWISDLIQPITS